MNNNKALNVSEVFSLDPYDIALVKLHRQAPHTGKCLELDNAMTDVQMTDKMIAYGYGPVKEERSCRRSVYGPEMHTVSTARVL